MAYHDGSQQTGLSTALVFSIGLHGLVLAFFLLSLSSQHSGAKTADPMMVQRVPETTLPIQAVSIDKQALEQEVQRLEQADHERQSFIQQAEQAKLTVKTLKEKQVQLAKQQESQIKALKVQAEKEKASLKAIEQKKAQQEKTLQELAQKKQAEEARLNKLKSDEVLLAKKRSEAKQELEAKQLALADLEKQSAVAKLNQEAALKQAEAARRQAEKKWMETELDRYRALIKQKIDQAWILPRDDLQSLSCLVEIQVLPDGSVLQSKVLRSSGHFAFDRATEAAINRASPLPMPQDQRLLAKLRHFTLTFKPPGAP